MGPATTKKAQSYEFNLQVKYECTVRVVHTNLMARNETVQKNK